MGNIADLEESVQHFKGAARQTLYTLSDCLTGAFNWIVAARENRLGSLDDAYLTYMNLLDRSLLIAASSIPDTHDHMVHIRKDRASLAEDATSHAIKTHRLSDAVEIAERGRALLFTQLGNYRTPLNKLEVVNKSLANRFRVLSTALAQSATSLPDTMAGPLTSEDKVAR
ncbi:hypothetical protein FRB93_010150 [Tulasnella sp. JGI-2019a]|nr:hypothetical protein FRB93_010150 [Tulasnella sp. JGI-2019a]